MPAIGFETLKHVVVLMMENRSFDHMLGALKATDSRIDGIDADTQFNLDENGQVVRVQPRAEFQGQLDPDPDHAFAAVDQQLYNGDLTPSRSPNMQGFVKNYYAQRRDVEHSHNVMYHFTADQLPVLTTLAQEFAVFNRWFASIPGPTLCNRAFAHYGTSFGHIGMEVFYANAKYKSVYERLEAAGKRPKIYYFDTKSSSLEVVNLLQHQPQFFGTYQQFLADCKAGTLPDYSFIEPNYSDHEGEGGGEVLASDQHPDHNVQEGEVFIASIYNAIRMNQELWASTALLIVYDEHGGIYDHVPPPICLPDGFVAQPDATKTGKPFLFDRLGVRVPAILVSPWIRKATVVPITRVFEHASIPATVTQFFLDAYDNRSPREKAAETFLDLLTLNEMRDDAPVFDVE